MYEVRTEEDQATAYRLGYREGELARRGYTQGSEYMKNSLGDFPLGSYSQQSTQGYHDGSNGLKQQFIHHKGRK